MKRFDFANKFKFLSIISPNNIINGEQNSIFDLVDEYPNFLKETEKQSLGSEFRELSFYDFKNIVKEDVKLIEFWKKISELKRGGSKYAFPVLTSFVENIPILPHSSANVERIFSQVNLNKTKVRNRLENESLEGILFTKDYLKLKNSNCFDVLIKSDLHKLLNSDMCK